MTTLNKTAAEIAHKYEIHAATDVTGFSFLGHLHEMMGGELSCVIDAHAVRCCRCVEAADACLYTAAGQRNRNHTGPFVRFENVPFPMEEILFDPQTSGGLLLAAAPQDAAALEQGTPGGRYARRHRGRDFGEANHGDHSELLNGDTNDAES